MEMLTDVNKVITGANSDVQKINRRRTIVCRGIVREVECDEKFDRKAVIKRVRDIYADTVIRNEKEKTELPAGNIRISTVDDHGSICYSHALWGGVCSLEPMTISISLPKNDKALSSIRVNRRVTIDDESKGLHVGCKVLKSLIIGEYVMLISEVSEMPFAGLTGENADIYTSMNLLREMKAKPLMDKVL